MSAGPKAGRLALKAEKRYARQAARDQKALAKAARWQSKVWGDLLSEGERWMNFLGGGFLGGGYEGGGGGLGVGPGGGGRAGMGVGDGGG